MKISAIETKSEKEALLENLRPYHHARWHSIFPASLFNTNKKQKFEEIDIERSNIVEKDGNFRMIDEQLKETRRRNFRLLSSLTAKLERNASKQN